MPRWASPTLALPPTSTTGSPPNTSATRPWARSLGASLPGKIPAGPVGETDRRTGNVQGEKLVPPRLCQAVAGEPVRGEGRGEAREGLQKGRGGGGGGGGGAVGETPPSPAHLFIACSSSSRRHPDLPWAPAPRLQRVQNQAEFFFFFLSGNWRWCVSTSLLPLPHPHLFFFFLRHGPGSGSWKRNKCGKRERKPELNDRMQAT